MNGVIVVDKPCGWTSHDVVNKVRRIAGTTKVGHLGTLDPLATGVLPLLLNRATRLAQYFTLNEKTYEGTIRFGFATKSYDAEGEPTSPRTEPVLTADAVEASLAPFRGTFLQTPPAVSAKKIQGRPAHELARKNIAVEMKPVEVTVHSLEILSIEGPLVSVRVHCSAGTYIRSIAHDAGIILGCGAHLQSLRRTQSGLFRVAQAHPLEQLSALASEDRLREALIPSGELLPEFPAESIDQITETQIRQGRDFRVSPFRDRGACRYVKALNRDGELIAIGEIVMPNLYHPALVL
ncbi:tRNA pseudouridine(55) synthase TruB [uncultured Paludibaculum sp.]|uniref:tRNA pseudouridine(55) synthase TruB n=1 Tax=uncultured Paludibaculum sp. TaxID=1765020 RepID=UPI002AABEDF5|nr:tRNA pseudouridine(55) synthase TruB [uncultured Paludibaculum sp.]